MRKDTLIMTLTMVLVTVGVYYGLEIVLRGDGTDTHNQFEVSAAPSKVISTSDTAASADEFEDETEADVFEEEPASEPEIVAEEEPETVDTVASSGASEDELTEIAVKAAVDEAVKAAADAAEKAVREAMAARQAQ